MNCAICKSEFYKDILFIENVPAETFGFSDETVTLQVAKCKSCGAVQLINPPVNNNFLEVYRSIGSLKEHREKKKEELTEFIEQYDLWEDEFFELGCGDGQFLDILREIGIEADGYEAGEDNRAKCEQKGYTVLDTLKDTFDVKYDVIVSFHFLEHLHDPVEAMVNVIDKLRPGGIIYFETPNWDFIKKNHLWEEFTRDHRFYYGIRSIKFLLQKVGFEKLIINNDTLTLKIIAFKSDIFKDIRETIYCDINNFNKLTSALGDYALVGAGHYSQTLLKMTNHKPKYIYDSVPVKIGNKLCGIIIQRQEDIIDCDCDNIIISCGVYNKDAEKNIKKLVKNKNIILWG